MNDELTDSAIARLLRFAAGGGAEPGDVAARYRIVREIGRGGMGIVYEAEDLDLGRRVALKVLNTVLPSPEASARFVREAKAAARLTHPGIATVFDATERYIAMRLVSGESLAQRGKLPPRVAARIVRDAALAVHSAHQAGIIHRDLKPANILLADERPIVTDFGLAKDNAAPEISASGQLLGTPAYMAPEQAAGRRERVAVTTDVYGLGATLYFALLGRAPFATTADDDLVVLIRRVIEEEPASPRSVDPTVARDLDAIVLRCLEKEPARRYASAADLAEDLTRFLEGGAVAARAPSWSDRCGRWIARRRLLVLIATFAAGVVAVALVAYANERAQRRSSAAALELSERVRDVLDDARRAWRAGETEARDARLTSGLVACDEFLARHDVAWGHVLKGRILAARGESLGALAEFDAALAREPSSAAARLERGMLVAAEIGRLAPGQAPEAVDSLPVAGRESRKRAMADLEAAIAADSTSRLDHVLATAELAALRGERAAARRGYDEVLRLEPTHERARHGLAALALIEGDADAALAWSMSALDLGRGFGPAYAANPPQDGPAFVVRALAGIRGEVIGFESFLALRPSDALAHAQRGVVGLRRAGDALVGADSATARDALADAIRDFDAALLLDPECAGAFLDRGVALLNRAALAAAHGQEQAAAVDRAAARSDFERAARYSLTVAAAQRNRSLLD